VLKKLFKCLREYKRDSIIAPILIIVETALEVVVPLLMANLIDLGINDSSMPQTVKWGLLMLAATFIAYAIGIATSILSSRASAGFAKNLRQDLYHNVQTFSFSNIDKFSSSSIVTRLTTDVSNVQMAFTTIIRVAVRAPSMLAFSLVMSFIINKTLSLIYVCAIPLLALGLYLIMKFAFPIFERVFRIYDKLNRVVQENLRGIRVVKSFVREDFEREKFNSVAAALRKNFSKAEKLLSFNRPLMQLAMFTCKLLACWIGAKLIINSGGSALTTGQLSSVLTYTMQMLTSLMVLSMVFVMITMSRSSAVRILEVLEEKSSINNPESPVYEVKDGSVSFDSVMFSYARKADKPVLDNINLYIESGETIGILGGTGSSKSSLVQLIPRLYDVTGGSVKVGGVDVRDYDIETLRNSVAMVLQKNELFSGSVKDNLRWGNENASDEEIKEVCRLAQADGFISEMPDGYDTWIEQGGSNVSGGQKQRLCIARALLKKPRILILDDSTSAVDTQTDAQIRAALRTYIPETTKFIIAQRVASVQDADKIIVMDDGHINGFGAHDELMASNTIYREIYTSQLKGGMENAS